MTDKAQTLRRLGVVLDECEGCGKAFDVRQVGLHGVVVLDPEHGEPVETDDGFFCSERCAKANEKKRREAGEHVAYHYTRLP